MLSGGPAALGRPRVFAANVERVFIYRHAFVLFVCSSGSVSVRCYCYMPILVLVCSCFDAVVGDVTASSLTTTLHSPIPFLLWTGGLCATALGITALDQRRSVEYLIVFPVVSKNA